MRGHLVYSAKVLGDSPVWAKKASACLRRSFDKQGIRASVRAQRTNVRVSIPWQPKAFSLRMGEQAQARAERACKV